MNNSTENSFCRNDLKKKIRIAYRCSYCGSVISADITKDMLSRPFKLSCIECGKSTLEIDKTPTGSVKLIVPCLMCPHSHPYTISEEMFFGKSIIKLPCSFSGLDICFIGDKDEVWDAIDESDAIISELTDSESFGDDQNERKSADMMLADTSVMREVLFAIGKLDEEKKISCSCGSHSVKVIIDYDKVRVVCKVCGKSTEIQARSRFDANDAIELDSISIY